MGGEQGDGGYKMRKIKAEAAELFLAENNFRIGGDV